MLPWQVNWTGREWLGRWVQRKIPENTWTCGSFFSSAHPSVRSSISVWGATLISQVIEWLWTSLVTHINWPLYISQSIISVRCLRWIGLDGELVGLFLYLAPMRLFHHTLLLLYLLLLCLLLLLCANVDSLKWYHTERNVVIVFFFFFAELIGDRLHFTRTEREFKLKRRRQGKHDSLWWRTK